MDLFSINSYNPFLNPFILLASTTSRGYEVQNIIMYSVKNYFLLFVLNLLPDHFIGCLHLCPEKYWLIIFLFTFSIASTVLQTSTTSLTCTHTPLFFLFSLCSWLFVAPQYHLWKSNGMQYLWYRHILHAKRGTTEVYHSCPTHLRVVLLFLFVHS